MTRASPCGNPQRVIGIVRMVGGGRVVVGVTDPAQRLSRLDQQADRIEADMRPVGIAPHVDLDQFAIRPGESGGKQAAGSHKDASRQHA